MIRSRETVRLSRTLLPVAVPSSSQPRSVAVEADGNLVVAGIDLVRVDPFTGDRTSVSDAGSGLVFSEPRGVAVEADGSLVVEDFNLQAVIRVNPVTGDRTIVSNAATGNGPALNKPVAIAVEADGSLVVADFSLDVVRVDPVTGDRTIVSDAATGSGPVILEPRGIAVEAGGHLVVTDLDRQAVVRVDPVTGDRTIVSDAATGSGPVFIKPRGIAVEADGHLVVTDLELQAVLRVDPVTGDRSFISNPLPVELTAFSGVADGARVLLAWEVASEVNNAGFEVQRNSANADGYQVIGFVRGQGTGDAASYHFADEAPPVDTLLRYRLKQIDFDGKFAYSDNVELGPIYLTTAELHANYPNPFNPVTTMSFALPRTEAVTLAVYDMLGHEVRRLIDDTLPAGTHTYTLDGTGLTSGPYVYRLVTESQVIARKMILLK